MKVSLNSKLKAYREEEAAKAAQKPKRFVPDDRARLIRSLASQLRNAQVNSKSYLAINQQLNKIYTEEMLLDEEFERSLQPN